MELLEFYGGFSASVDGVSPVQEYCLKYLEQTWRTCMTKSEWSGWAQAFGGFLAILGAVLIASSQERKARINALRVAVARVRIAHAGIARVATNVANNGAKLIEEAEKKRLLAEEYLMIARSVNYELLSPKWNGRLDSLRADAVRIISSLKNYEQSKPTVGELHWHEYWHENMADEARQVELSLAFCGLVFDAPHPGLRECSNRTWWWVGTLTLCLLLLSKSS